MQSVRTAQWPTMFRQRDRARVELLEKPQNLNHEMWNSLQNTLHQVAIEVTKEEGKKIASRVAKRADMGLIWPGPDLRPPVTPH